MCISFGWITELLRCCCPFEASIFFALPQPHPTHLPTPPLPRRCWQGERPAVAELRPVQRGAHSPRVCQSGPEAAQRWQLQAAQHQEDCLMVCVPSVPPSAAPPPFSSSSSPTSSSTHSPSPPQLPPSLPGLTTALRFLLFSSPNSIFMAVVPGRSGFAFCTEEENQELFGVARGELWTFRWKGIRRLVEVEVEGFFLRVLGARCWYWRPATATEKDSGTWRGYWSFWPIFLKTVISESRSENSPIWFLNNTSLCWVLFCLFFSFFLWFNTPNTDQTDQMTVVAVMEGQGWCRGRGRGLANYLARTTSAQLPSLYIFYIRQIMYN